MRFLYVVQNNNYLFFFCLICSFGSERFADERQKRHEQLFCHHRFREGEISDIGQGESLERCGLERGMRTVSISIYNIIKNCF